MEERELLDVGERKERHRERDTKEMRVGIKKNVFEDSSLEPPSLQPCWCLQFLTLVTFLGKSFIIPCHKHSCWSIALLGQTVHGYRLTLLMPLSWLPSVT